jgi:uncharacterized protein (TIGR02145 family)
MKKILYIINFILILTVLPAHAQIVTIKSETIRLFNDSLLLKVGQYRGDIKWQYSVDFNTWIDISEANNEKLLLKSVDREGWYRAKITEGSCLPLCSDTVEIQFTTPLVETVAACRVGSDSATVSGKITDDGGTEITKKGFYWSRENPDPDSNSNITSVDTDSFEFSATLKGLKSDTTYHFKAFATNSKGTVTGEAGTFKTDEEETTGTFTDNRDGRTYKWVKIGAQTWMAENLAFKTTTGSWAYNNDENNVPAYGRLYNWDTAVKVCPEGWHLPSDEEYKQLEMHLGMTRAEADMANTWRGSPVGTMLKIGGQAGFDAPLAGRWTNTSFASLGSQAYLWSSTESTSNLAWRRCLFTTYSTVGRYDTFPKYYGFSVRCVKND